jgi:hypothetical protein
MSRNSWEKIRSIADPETISRAELRTEAMLASMDQQYPAESDDPADGDAPREKDEQRG